MRPPQRKPNFSLTQKLVREPFKFQLSQAARVARAWVDRPAQASGKTGRMPIRYQNHAGLHSPTAGIEAFQAEMPEIGEGLPENVTLTPSIGGLLGTGGTLPYHYTEALLAAGNRDAGILAFFDFVAQRAHALGIQAHTLEQAELPDLRTIECSLAGFPGQSSHAQQARSEEYLPADFAAFYAVILRHPTVSASTLGQVLSEFFCVPVQAEEFVPEMLDLEPGEQVCLGKHGTLGGGFALGARAMCKQKRVRLRIGPLSLNSYQQFLPRGPAAAALAAVLRLFRVADLSFEVQLVLKADAIEAPQLRSDASWRLGHSSFLTSAVNTVDREGVCYQLDLHG